MKIQPLSVDNHNKTAALLRQAFPDNRRQEQLFTSLHGKSRSMLEWVCIHTGRYIAYIAFTNAYNGSEICGLHLTLLAVNPEFQHQGIGTELLRFALRQKEIRDKTVFVLGEPRFYERFGFQPCHQPLCSISPGKSKFLALRNNPGLSFTVGYEPEYQYWP